MKKNNLKLILSTILFLSLFALASKNAFANDITTNELTISAENFPDENFRILLSDLADTDKNGTLSKEEINNLQIIDKEKETTTRGKIASLEGIHNFENLVYVNLPDEKIKSYDATTNSKLQCIMLENNELNSISVAGLEKLQKINVSNNHLAMIDLEGTENLSPNLTNLGSQKIIPSLRQTVIQDIYGGRLSDNITYEFNTESHVNSIVSDEIEFNYDSGFLLAKTSESSTLQLSIRGTELADILNKNQKLYYNYNSPNNNVGMHVEIEFKKAMILDKVFVNSPKIDYIEGDELDLSTGTGVANAYEGLELSAVQFKLNDTNVSVTGYDKNKIGKQTLTVHYNTTDDNILTTTYDIIVSPKQDDTVKVSKIKISPSFSILRKNRTKQLSTTISPAGAKTELTWSSSNPSVASVDETGNVTAHKFGIVTISASDATSKVTGKTLILAF